MSRRTARPDAATPEELGLPEPLLALAAISAPLDLVALFGRPGAVELEIGTGKGRFLIAEAGARPEILFLGLEYAGPYIRVARARVVEARRSNIRLLQAEAVDALGRLIPPASLRAIHVLFPDPWPRRRHHHRRLLQPGPLRLMAAALAPGGLLNVATDHDDYAATIPRAVAAVPELEPLACFGLGPGIESRTHFGVKMSARGATIFARSWRRRA